MSKEALEAAKARKKAAQEANGTVPAGADAKIEADKPFLPLYAFAGFATAAIVSLIIKKWKSK
jgi:hypothetical protein